MLGEAPGFVGRKGARTMGEVIGWVFLVVAAICSLGVFGISAGTRQPDMDDRRPVWERDYEHHSRLAGNPRFALLVFGGLAFGLLGMYLIGMFG